MSMDTFQESLEKHDTVTILLESRPAGNPNNLCLPNFSGGLEQVGSANMIFGYGRNAFWSLSFGARAMEEVDKKKNKAHHPNDGPYFLPQTAGKIGPTRFPSVFIFLLDRSGGRVYAWEC